MSGCFRSSEGLSHGISRFWQGRICNECSRRALGVEGFNGVVGVLKRPCTHRIYTWGLKGASHMGVYENKGPLVYTPNSRIPLS